MLTYNNSHQYRITDYTADDTTGDLFNPTVDASTQ